MKKRTWLCRYMEDGVMMQHMATGHMYANKSTACFECEKHSVYLKGNG